MRKVLNVLNIVGMVLQKEKLYDGVQLCILLGT